MFWGSDLRPASSYRSVRAPDPCANPVPSIDSFHDLGLASSGARPFVRLARLCCAQKTQERKFPDILSGEFVLSRLYLFSSSNS